MAIGHNANGDDESIDCDDDDDDDDDDDVFLWVGLSCQSCPRSEDHSGVWNVLFDCFLKAITIFLGAVLNLYDDGDDNVDVNLKNQTLMATGVGLWFELKLPASGSFSPVIMVIMLDGDGDGDDDHKSDADFSLD